MELRRPEEITEISRYWTPEHLDVTHVPMTYARPKATWIDGYERLRPRVTSDSSERLARRRMSTHAVVDPAEITVLPALQPARPATARVRRPHRRDERAFSAGSPRECRHWSAARARRRRDLVLAWGAGRGVRRLRGVRAQPGRQRAQAQGARDRVGGGGQCQRDRRVGDVHTTWLTKATRVSAQGVEAGVPGAVDAGRRAGLGGRRVGAVFAQARGDRAGRRRGAGRAGAGRRAARSGRARRSGSAGR